MTYYEPDSQKGLFGLIALWTIGLVALISIIGVAIWGIGVLTAEPKGRAEAYKQQRSANNRIFQQAQFRSQAETINGYATQITIATDALKTASADTRMQRETELVGLRQICVSTVNDYNARAKQYLAKDFRDNDLPERYDPNSTCGGN